MTRWNASDSRTGERRRQAVLVRCGTLAAAAVAAMTAVIPALRQELDLPFASLALLGILLVNLMVFERTRAYRPAVGIVLGSSASFFLMAVHYTSAHPATVVWASLFQTLPYFLAGRRVGGAVVILFDATLVAIILGTAGPDSLIADDRTFVTGLVASMLTLAAVSFLFEHAREIAHRRLLIEVGERRRAEAEARRASEVAAKAAAAQARFLANMSHEIRTPMNGVLGVNELLLMTSLTDEQRDYAKTINGSAKSLLTVLNDILDLSKIESGHVTLERRAFDLREFLTSLVALYAPEAQKKGLRLEIAVDDAVPKTVEGDDQRLRQVLANLLRNAVKFTEQGQVDLVVRLHDKGDRVRFEVRDTGIGLAPAQKVKIFEAFQQADTSTTRRYGGTGLGLSISKQLIELMGGQIGADGRPGRGSVFWCIISLPEAEAPLPERPRPSMTMAAPDPSVDRRVLVVEDNPVNRKVVCRMLERMNLTVDCAEDGEVALSMWEPQRYQLVLMDVQMPRLDGFDTTRTIRRRETTNLRTPIIALTANAMPGDRERCLASGMDDYLSKPVVFRDLKRVVAEWIVDGDETEDTDAPPMPRVRTLSPGFVGQG